MYNELNMFFPVTPRARRWYLRLKSWIACSSIKIIDTDQWSHGVQMTSTLVSLFTYSDIIFVFSLINGNVDFSQSQLTIWAVRCAPFMHNVGTSIASMTAKFNFRAEARHFLTFWTSMASQTPLKFNFSPDLVNFEMKFLCFVQI